MSLAKYFFTDKEKAATKKRRQFTIDTSCPNCGDGVARETVCDPKTNTSTYSCLNCGEILDQNEYSEYVFYYKIVYKDTGEIIVKRSNKMMNR